MTPLKVSPRIKNSQELVLIFRIESEAKEGLQLGRRIQFHLFEKSDQHEIPRSRIKGMKWDVEILGAP